MLFLKKKKSLKSAVTSDTTWNYPDKYFQRFYFCLILQNVFTIDIKRLSAQACIKMVYTCIWNCLAV